VRYADEHRAEPWRDIDPVDVDDQESLDDEFLTVLANRRPT
jgi:hypothetical protein